MLLEHRFLALSFLHLHHLLIAFDFLIPGIFLCDLEVLFIVLINTRRYDLFQIAPAQVKYQISVSVTEGDGTQVTRKKFIRRVKLIFSY